MDRAALLRRIGALGAAAAVPAALAEAARGGSAFPPHPSWRVVFVNHQTTDPFFVATQYGAADACALLGCTLAWTGSAKGDVHEAAAALGAAVESRPAGIAVSVVDPDAFERPLARAAARRIPVVAYFADAGRSTGRRLPFVGQDAYAAGVAMGERIGRLVPRGDLGLFASLPDAEEVARTIAGVRSALAGRAGTIRVVATGEDVSTQVARVDATVQKRKGLAGLFGVDGGSTVGIALAAKKYGLAHANVQAGGAGVLPPTLQAVQDGSLAFTTDQQPYLQGFLPVVQLFLAKVSGGLVQPVDADTGHVFVTKANVGPYLATRTRFEGSSSKPQAVGTH